MKQFFAAFLFVLISPTLQAQVLSGGFRVGPTAFLDLEFQESYLPFAYQQAAITPEIFGRYQGKKRWAFEGTLSVSRLQYEQRVTASGTTWERGLEKTNTYYYELGLAAQYELSCRKATKLAQQPRLHYFIGLSASGALVNDRSNIYEDGYPDRSVMMIVRNEFQVWAGWNHMLSYDLTPHWTLMAKGDLRMNLNHLTGLGYGGGSDYPDVSVGFKVGAGYRIWQKKSPKAGVDKQ